MPRRSLLALAVLAGCVGRSAGPEPVATPVAREDPVTPARPRPTHFVRLGETVALDGETSLRVEDVIVEAIAANPDDPQSYPAGSGVSVTVVLARGGQEQRATLTQLSAGYESRAEVSLHGYRVALVEVHEPHRSPRVALAVTRA